MIDFNKFFIIAGPCVIWSEQHLLDIGGKLQEITNEFGVQWVLKASYDKANRSSINSYRGPGFDEGLTILSHVKYQLGCFVTSDVHGPQDCDTAAGVLDIIQIPAFLCRQTDLLVEAGKTGKPVNIKKGQFIDPYSVRAMVNKVRTAKKERPRPQILVTERGTQFGNSDVVVDFRYVGKKLYYRKSHWNILDVTHAVKSWDHSLTLAKAGVAVGVDGIFVEVGSKGCDEKRGYPVEIFKSFLEEVLNIRYAVREKEKKTG